MKKILIILFILTNFKTLSASEYRDKVFTLDRADRVLVCDHDETFELSAWQFREIKDEILGDFTLVKPLGVIKDKDNNPPKDLFTKGTLTVLDKNHIPTATRWVELSYDKIDLSIKSIALFGFLNKNIRDEGFRLITIVYEFKDSDKDFLNKTSEKLKAARLSLPLSPSKADDIDARNHFIQILGITKISLRKQFEMDNDKTYKRKRSTYLCQLHS